MTEPINVLHLADIHFGMENYGYTNPSTGLHSRLEDFIRSLNQAIDYALDLPVDLAVFAGDAYKRNSPSPTEQRELIKPFLRLAEAGVPTVMISGNHDIPVMHGKAASIDIFRALRPGMFYVYVNQPTLGANAPPIIETPKGPIAVCCLPYISPSFLMNIGDYRNLRGDELRDAYESFYDQAARAMAASVPDDVPRLLIAHLTVAGAMVGGYRGVSLAMDETQVQPANLASAGYDYVALGHIHRYQNLSPRDEVPVVYCGSIDRIDFGERDEIKGFVIARVRRGRAEHEFIPVQTRDFIQLDVDSQRGDDLTARILEAIHTERIDDAVVRIRFAADDEELQKIDMKAVHEALRPAHFKAGFIRTPREQSASRRTTTLQQDAALADALAAYLREREELKQYGEALLVKAKEIDAIAREKML